MSANVKEKFADLKYEQLLNDKYFIETCFSKKYTSDPSHHKLEDLRLQIDLCYRKPGISQSAEIVLPCPESEIDFCEPDLCVSFITTTTTTTINP